MSISENPTYVDVFADSYWEPFNVNAVKPSTTPLRARRRNIQVEKSLELIEDLEHDAYEDPSSLSRNFTELPRECLIRLAHVPTGTIIAFQREQRIEVVASDATQAFARLERILPFRRFLGIRSQLQIDNDPKPGVHTASRYELQEGFGIVLEDLNRQKTSYGISRIENGKEKTPRPRVYGSFLGGLTAVQIESPGSKPACEYMPLRLPYHQSAQIGKVAISASWHGMYESTTIFERLNYVGYHLPK